jgi:CRP-like cAMP-binding protein
MSGPWDVERLRALPLFGELDHHDLSRLAAITHEVAVAAGEVVVAQGELPYEVLVIEEGEVEVTRNGEVLGTLGAGQLVGEIALVEQQRRMATVTAKTDLRAVVISAVDLNVLAGEMPEVVEDIRSTARVRERQNEQR